MLYAKRNKELSFVKLVWQKNIKHLIKIQKFKQISLKILQIKHQKERLIYYNLNTLNMQDIKTVMY